jgi:CRP/FNR family transcriptional regulator
MPTRQEDLRQLLLGLYPALHSLAVEQLSAICPPQALLRLPAGAQVFSRKAELPGISAAPCRHDQGREEHRQRARDAALPRRSGRLVHHQLRVACSLTALIQRAASPKHRSPCCSCRLRCSSRLLGENRLFRDFVFHLFAERIAALMQLVEEVAFHRLDQRLAKLLLARGESITQHTPGAGRRTGQCARDRQPLAQGLRRTGTGGARPRADYRHRPQGIAAIGRNRSLKAAKALCDLGYIHDRLQSAILAPFHHNLLRSLS